MSEKTIVRWDALEDAARWLILNATDLHGLTKCQVARQPWKRLSASIQRKLQAAHTKNTQGVGVLE